MRTEIKNTNGKVRYVIFDRGDRKDILSANNQLLGFIKDGKTYSNTGTQVSQGEDASCLVV